jgi:hypothetical protein
VLCGREIPTTFVMLSPEENTKALLRADFIEDAGLVLDLAAKQFYFCDAPQVGYPLTPKDRVEEHVMKTPRTAVQVAHLQPLPEDEPMDEGNYGPSILVGPTKVPPRGYWNIHQAPGAVEYMWADAVMSTAELFLEDDDFATPLAITSLHLKVHEAADTRRKRRL